MGASTKRKEQRAVLSVSQRKAKRREQEAEVTDLPNDNDQDAPEDDEELPHRQPKAKQKGSLMISKVSQKRKRGELDPEAAPPATVDGGDSRSKKRKTKQSTNDPKRDNEVQSQEAGSKTKEAKPQRFIVFIGNLPFTASMTTLTKHFAAVKPISVRNMTHKDDPKKSKGFAFLEFDGYDHMKSCLKLYHHSTFSDGLSPARKINVELTAGGGGKSTVRKTKLKEKNVKLNEERWRRAVEEQTAKRKASATDGESAPARAVVSNDIHPSRRGRVPRSN
ncbi:MAG: hypothetical protein M1829_005531 [Trizodia sp. TS-e1964]|nr:MAG: hypothetical protein M1829_005531 [Trizodia sp. TS-e1964]